MKWYLVITGGLFALVGIAHLVRQFVEPGHSYAEDPGFLVGNLALFVVGTGFAGWACVLLRRLPRREP